MNFIKKVKKSLGQNFLTDKNIVNKIVEIGNIEKNKAVLEIGPGYGSLTRKILSKNPKKIFAIEKDKNLASFLINAFKDFSNIRVINNDILDIIGKKNFGQNVIVFGNLPYNISTEILCKWILNLNDEKIWFSNLILMFQKEVADRIISNYNCSNMVDYLF